MQLISLLLLLFSLFALVGAILFVVLWHRAYRRASVVQMLHESIGHIGISVIVEYPETPAPLLSLLEERYPRSEAVIVTDLQHFLSPFGELIPRFQLIRVNHSHLVGVRALYRSRHRAFRRVVMVDLPVEYRHHGATIGKSVASYDYVLHLQGESVVAHNAISYCANIIATQSVTKDLSLHSIVGAEARLERSDMADTGERVTLRAHRPLAWRRERLFLAMFAILTPAFMVVMAHFTGSRIALFAAIVTTLAVSMFLYVSCRVMAEKSLFATLDTILQNFCRYLVERVRNFHYLYEERGESIKTFVRSVVMFARKDRKDENQRPL